MQDKTTLEDALALMRDLRARCEWDAAQTHASLRPYLLEEAHELDDALRAGADGQIREELADVLLQVLFHSVIAEERGSFDAYDVADALITKMRGRHRHLYDDGERESWEGMKAAKRASIVDGLPVDLPALHRAHRLQDRAAGVGFDWPDVDGPSQKVDEELAEVREHLRASPIISGAGGVPVIDDRHLALEEELGDLLFACVNMCRKAGVHASLALDRANEKFARRFQAMEAMAVARGERLADLGLERLDEMWEKVKQGQAPAADS